MGSGEVAIVALSTMISLKVTFSDGLGGYSTGAPITMILLRPWNDWQSMLSKHSLICLAPL